MRLEHCCHNNRLRTQIACVLKTVESRTRPYASGRARERPIRPCGLRVADIRVPQQISSVSSPPLPELPFERGVTARKHGLSRPATNPALHIGRNALGNQPARLTGSPNLLRENQLESASLCKSKATPFLRQVKPRLLTWCRVSCLRRFATRFALRLSLFVTSARRAQRMSPRKWASRPTKPITT